MNYLQVEKKLKLKPIGFNLTHIARNELHERPFSCRDPKYSHDIPASSVKFSLLILNVIDNVHT